MAISTTEEDIKNKVVVPWLELLGFEKNELSYEETFSVQVGRYVIKNDTDKQIRSCAPRVDILVKRDGKNFFVIEVKRDSKDIDDNDIQQATSYACLARAPLTVVANGKNFKILETWSRNEIEANKAIILGKYSLAPDLTDYYEQAFESFIGYSHENVKIFCEEQLKEGMKTLLGSKDDLGKKFIPELYVPSKKLYKVFGEFLQSDKPVFAIVGESGVGKTCSMCGIARTFLNEYPVLFYKAQELKADLVKVIADDFNWQFSTNYDDISLLKRLDRLFKDKKILIFLDGVDEWANVDKVAILGDLASKIKNRSFKLVISCKSGRWYKFLCNLGTPTSLSEEIFSANPATKGFLVEPFDGEEFHSLIERYREFYNFEGLFESALLDECKRLPFLLRVFFEVAHKTKYAHLTFSMKEFYDEYNQAVMDKILGERAVIENLIKSIAKVLYEKNIDLIDSDTLRRELSLHINDSIPESLFECNILETTETESETLIGFYFKKFRDYIIAFKVNKWHSTSIEEFKEKIARLDLRDVQLDALNLFYRLTETERKETIDGQLKSKAEAYLDLYTSALNKHFYNLKHRFLPHTEGEIGFVGDLDIKNQRVRAYGFKPLAAGENRITFLPLEESFWRNDTNLAYLAGATQMHYFGSSDAFRDIDITKEVLKNEIASQLFNIIKEGRLNEGNNYYLSLEKTLGIIVEKQRNYHGIEDRFSLSKYLPIAIDKIKYWIRYEQAYHYFENQLIEKRIEEGIIKQQWSGGTCSYGYSFSREDHELIKKQASKVASEKIKLDRRVVDIDTKKTFEMLNEALNAIRKRKHAIDETVLPDRDAWPTGSSAYVSEFFKPETLKFFFQKIYTLFLSEYKTLIETNFPTLKECFELYSQMPVRYFLLPFHSGRNWIEYYICRNLDGDQNEVILCDDSEVVFDRDEFSITYRHKCYKVLKQCSSNVHTLISPYKNFITVSMPSEFIILRSLVYHQIEEEVPKAIENLFKLYDLLIPPEEIKRMRH